MSSISTPDDPPGLLRCANCGKTIKCTIDDMLRFAQTAWPECCDEVMTLFVPTVKPAPDQD